MLRNPYRKDGNHHAGNKMALANIRERLALHFDAEAALETEVPEHAYEVHIGMPYRTESTGYVRAPRAGRVKRPRRGPARAAPSSHRSCACVTSRFAS